MASDPAQPSSVRILADWNDIEAAALVAAAETEAAVLQITQPRQDKQVVEFRNIRDEPITVTVRRLAPDTEPDGPVEMELTCQYGRFGDAREQARLLEAFQRRLEDLRGVDYREVH